MLYSEFQKEQKKKEKKGFDIQEADDFAQGLRASSSSRDHFLRAVGESRLMSRKEREKAVKTEDNEFVKKTRKDHERKVKAELKAMQSTGRSALVESIFRERKSSRKKEKVEEKEDKKKKD